jgi:hypothetical protein
MIHFRSGECTIVQKACLEVKGVNVEKGHYNNIKILYFWPVSSGQMVALRIC